MANTVALAAGGINFTKFSFFYFGVAGIALLVIAWSTNKLVRQMTFKQGTVLEQKEDLKLHVDEDDEDQMTNDDEEGEGATARLVGASTVSSSSLPLPCVQNDTSTNKSVSKGTWLYRLAVFLSFFVTLICFPAIKASIKMRGNSSSKSPLPSPPPRGGGSSSYCGDASGGGSSYWTYFLFLLFNVGDLCGRQFEGSSFAKVRGLQNVSGAVAFRRSLYCLLFIPILSMCNVVMRD